MQLGPFPGSIPGAPILLRTLSDFGLATRVVRAGDAPKCSGRGATGGATAWFAGPGNVALPKAPAKPCPKRPLDSRITARKRSPVLVYAVVDDSLSLTSPLGDALEVYVCREDAERFIEEVRGDDPELARPLRIEERKLEAGRLAPSPIPELTGRGDAVAIPCLLVEAGLKEDAGKREGPT
jgi:hypothetical protein